jgi:UDP-N-acetylmuramoylalanine--D-glutamate ligase
MASREGDALAGKSVVVVGLGATGAAVVGFATAAGADVSVVEDRAAGDPYSERAANATRGGARVLERPGGDAVRALVARADLVVPSPGVHLDHPALVAAREHGVRLRSEVDLAVERLRRRDDAPRIVAVTGTNGKTTVTTLVAAMVTASGLRAVAAGNIGWPLIDIVDDDVEVVVAETSSFQLELTTDAFVPDVAVLLNVAVDHLDWHGSPAAYAAAKARVFAHQGPDDVLVVDADDPVADRLAATARSRVVRVGADGASHDVVNARAAAAAAAEVGAAPDAVARVLAGFRGLPHRVQLVAELGGVRYYDDSKATNPHATISALRSFDRVVLIAGGRNKDLDLADLSASAGRLRAVVAIGESAGEIDAVFTRTGTDVTHASSMREAVRLAAAHACAGDVVLLSPACASFDWYESYAARGDDFAREVERLEEESA